MMELEPIDNTAPLQNTVLDKENEKVHGHGHGRIQQQRPLLSTQAVTEGERRMIFMLLPSDVLLVGRPQLRRIVSGNAQYQELLQKYASEFSSHDSEVHQQEVVHSIMASVWSNNGRFLQHDSLKETISILSNAQVEQRIRDDLKQNERRREWGKLKNNNKETETPSSMLKQSKSKNRSQNKDHEKNIVRANVPTTKKTRPRKQPSQVRVSNPFQRYWA